MFPKKTALCLVTALLTTGSATALADATAQSQLNQLKQQFINSVFQNAGADAPAVVSYDDYKQNNTEDQSNTQGVVTLHAVNLGDETLRDAPLTFGQVFKQGDVPGGRDLTVTIDGQNYPAQTDKKTTWPDGSIRNAVISLRVPELLPGQSKPLQLVTADNTNGGPRITINDLLATDFNASISIKRGGQTLTANARELLRDAANSGGCPDWGKRCKQWLEGARASEWIVGGSLNNGNTPDEHLAVYFNVRAYASASGAIDNVRVDTVIENNHAYSATSQNQTYDGSIRVGDKDYEIDNLKHYRQARWHRVLWWQDKPDVYAKQNVAYLQSTKAISQYADVTPTDAFLNGRPKSFKPMDNGDQTRDMGDQGAQPAIGPLPQWSAAYAVSADHRAFRWMLANDDAVGSYKFHYRDNKTGRPVEITKRPYVTIIDYAHAQRSGRYEYRRDLLAGCPSNCGTPYTFDISHHPSIGYLPYLVTGDFYYLEEMQFAASYVELWPNAKYRNYGQGRLRGAQSQVRGQAWGMRSIADAAFATPDNDPMKTYFKKMVKNIVADYNRKYVDQPAKHPLHVLDDYGAVIYPFHGRSRVGIAPWQAHFFAWSAGHLAEQGVPGAQRLSTWLAEFPIRQMTGWKNDSKAGYCWLNAAIYKLKIRDSRGSKEYASLDEAYQNTLPEQAELDCNSLETTYAMSSNYINGEMSGYAHSPTGFPSNLQIGLAMAAASGVENGPEAWQIFLDRSVKPDYRNNPTFAVVPRD